MKLREIMTRNVHLVSQSQTIQEAAQLMLEKDIGLLPVYNGNTLVGVVTDRDIVVNAVARGLNPTKTSISDAMTKNVISCSEDDSLNKAVQIMKEKQIRRMVITDRDKRLVGIVSLGDIATRLTGNIEIAEDVLHQVSEDRYHTHH